jgi:ABC-type transport system involved in multi-copper enzyme maturation permease subunit
LIQDKINPIILREMRGRMRNRRTFFGLTSYAMLLGGLAGIIYASFYYSASYSQVSNLATPSIEIGPYLGKTLFSVTVILLLIMLPFSAATLAADAIAGEKERQTYEILRITPMSSQRLVWGKLGAVFVLLVLYILIALPLLVLAFLFGGVTVGEMLIATLGLLVTALAFTAWGLYVSSVARSTKVATAVSSTLILFFIYGLPFMLWMGTIMIGLFIDNQIFNDPDPLLMIFFIYAGGFLASNNPLGAAVLTAMATMAGYNYFIFSMPGQNGQGTLWFVSPWLVYVIFYLLLTLAFVFLTRRKLTKISEV